MLTATQAMHVVDKQLRLKCVLLLGAGASAASDAGLPTMRGFFHGQLHNFGALRQFLHSYYGARPTTEWNLEECLAYLAKARTQIGSWDPALGALFTSHLGDAYSECLSFVEVRLAIHREMVCAKTAALVNSLGSRDTIITLNYDLVVDQALEAIDGSKSPDDHRLRKLTSILSDQPLWDGSTLPTLRPSDYGTGFYLKLHGSLGWLSCLNYKCPSARRVFVRTRENDTLGQFPGEPCRVCGDALGTLLVPPVSSKRVDERGRLALLWNLAFRELRAAEEWILVGISLSPSDSEIRHLLTMARLTSATPKRVTVVDPDAPTRTRIADFLQVAPTEFESIESLLARQ